MKKRTLRTYLRVDIKHCLHQKMFQLEMSPELKTYAEGSYEDIWGVRRKPVKTGQGSYDHEILNPLSSISIIEELESWEPPSADWYDYGSLVHLCERYEDYATVLVDERTNRTSVLHAAMYLRGMQQALIDLLTNPKITRRLYRKITAFYLEVNRRCFEAAGDRIDIFMMGDDMGRRTAS